MFNLSTSDPGTRGLQNPNATEHRSQKKISRTVLSLLHPLSQMGRVQETPPGRSQAKPVNQHRPHSAQSNQIQEKKPNYNSKLVCQTCGKVGHSDRDCYHRNTTEWAYRNVPYPKESTEGHKQFRRDFRHANNRVYNANELSTRTQPTTRQKTPRR